VEKKNLVLPMKDISVNERQIAEWSEKYNI
jgi:hypothetical protein